jgi:mannose-1-phosphate guanylyltransferase
VNTLHVNPIYQALLLAAGEGTRLRPLTLTTPKCLVPVLGRPLLGYWLQLLARGPSPGNVWINTSYLASQVKDFLKASEPVYPHLSIRETFEPQLLGTAGTLVNLLGKLQPDQDLLLAHADNLSWFSLQEFLNAHQKRPLGTELTMMTFRTDTPQSCGIVEVDKQNVVRVFHEKAARPPSNLANGAVYLISPAGLARIKSMGPMFEFSTQVIPQFMGKIYCWQNTTYHRDIGNTQAYQASQSDFWSVAAKFGLNTE